MTHLQAFEIIRITCFVPFRNSLLRKALLISKHPTNKSQSVARLSIDLFMIPVQYCLKFPNWTLKFPSSCGYRSSTRISTIWFHGLRGTPQHSQPSSESTELSFSGGSPPQVVECLGIARESSHQNHGRFMEIWSGIQLRRLLL